MEYCQVLGVAGNAEILGVDGIRWLPLSPAKFLKAGDKIRTSAKSYADLSTGADLSGLLRLGESSEMEVIGDDFARFFLRQGTLMALREPDSGTSATRAKEPPVLFQIFTKNASVAFLQGGCSVSLAQDGALMVRVFSEHVKITPFGGSKEKTYQKSVPEGFKVHVPAGKNAPPQEPARMHFKDYAAWQAWMKDCYARKDARAQDLLVQKR